MRETAIRVPIPLLHVLAAVCSLPVFCRLEFVAAASPTDHHRSAEVMHTQSASTRLPGLVYHPEGDAIVVRNGTRWDNRPLYCNAREMVVMAGEMPGISCKLGVLRVAVSRGDVRVPLDQFQDRIARYLPGRMEWEVRDDRFPGLVVTMTATTVAKGDGFTVRVRSKGVLSGDRLHWVLPNASLVPVPGGFKAGDAYVSVSGGASSDLSVLLRDKVRCDFAMVAGVKPQPATRAFEDGLARVTRLGRQVVVTTPDPWFNAGVGASCAAMYGLYIEPWFAHGGSAWRVCYPGWRIMDGATAYGWHKQVAGAITYHGDRQVKVSPNRTADPDPFGAEQSSKSRYHGVGKITTAGLYDMQTQFFDQCCRAWRATGDPGLARQLLPMLELHLKWAKDCFDPDDHGLYESYINTWPTDSVWYNGGGTVEESAYIAHQRRTAADLCRRIGRLGDAQRHDAEADKIHDALDRVLWLPEKGQYAAYIEQGGLGRVHDDAWVYSQHLPIEAGLSTPQQAWQAMYYTDWAMEKYRLRYGGEMRQTSNWIPQQWSTRELYAGDNFAMALGYYLAGQGEEGWALLRGAMLESMYGDPEPKAGYRFAANHISPGGLSHPSCAIDFTDVVSMFCRAVVEGLFGYQPDYPNGIVTVTPGLPADWGHASISTPDYSLRFRRDPVVDRYTVRLVRPARMRVRLPIHAERIDSVRVNGASARWRVEPWAGCGMLLLDLPRLGAADIEIRLSGRTTPPAARHITKAVTETIAIDNAIDPQNCLGPRATPGHHLAFALVQRGNVPYLQVYKVTVIDPEGESRQSAKLLREPAPNAAWRLVSLDDVYNGDVRMIFQQKYAEPRPATVSCRLGYDGWSAWTFKHWGMSSPMIGLQNVGYYDGPLSPVYEAIDPVPPVGGGPLTLEAWLEPGQQSSAGGRIIDWTPPGTLDGFLLDTYPGNSLRLLTSNGELTARDALTPGKAAHVAGVYDPVRREMRLYIDGREVAARTDGEFPPIRPILRSVRIGGADADGSERFIGRIHRVAMHAGALTAEQVAARSAQPDAAPAAIWDCVLTRDTGRVKRIDTDPSGLTHSSLLQNGNIMTPQGVPFALFDARRNIAFTSRWDNWPVSIQAPVQMTGDAIWLLVAGSTNPMQGRIANAALLFHYADGQTERLELVPPLNFWSLCRFGSADYDLTRDAFALSPQPPLQVQLGDNCRAMLYGWRLRPGVVLREVELEALSQEVVIGLMGVTVMNPK